MKKKMLVLLLVILIAATAYLYTRPTLPAMSIDRVYNVTNVGDTVLLNATLTDVPSCQEWVLKLVWDPYVVKLTEGGPNSTRPAAGGPSVQLIEGPFMRDVGATHFIVNYANNTLGRAVLGVLFVASGVAASGTGVIFSMNFTIVRLGTTAIGIEPPFLGVNRSILLDAGNHDIDHAEANGLITEKGPPPAWASASFQTTVVATEVVVFGAASAVVYWRTHRKPPKSERRRAELQPRIEPEDQA